MAYTPTNWSTGDTITASDMNKLENAVANAAVYDAVIYIYHDNNTAHDYQYSVLSGNYNTLLSMLNNNIPPNILVKYWDDMLNLKATANAVALYYVNSGSDPHIHFVMQIPNTGASSGYNFYGQHLYWYSDNEINMEPL